jgi:hypothetical protein
MGRIVRGSDCDSQHLDPLLRGQIEWFGGGRTVQPLWGRIVTICKCLWGESLQSRMVPVGVSQCPNGGGLIIKASRSPGRFSIHTTKVIIMKRFNREH